MVTIRDGRENAMLNSKRPITCRGRGAARLWLEQNGFFRRRRSAIVHAGHLAELNRKQNCIDENNNKGSIRVHGLGHARCMLVTSSSLKGRGSVMPDELCARRVSIVKSVHGMEKDQSIQHTQLSVLGKSVLSLSTIRLTDKRDQVREEKELAETSDETSSSMVPTDIDEISSSSSNGSHENDSRMDENFGRTTNRNKVSFQLHPRFANASTGPVNARHDMETVHFSQNKSNLWHSGALYRMNRIKARRLVSTNPEVQLYISFVDRLWKHDQDDVDNTAWYIKQRCIQAIVPGLCQGYRGLEYQGRDCRRFAEKRKIVQAIVQYSKLGKDKADAKLRAFSEVLTKSSRDDASRMAEADFLATRMENEFPSPRHCGESTRVSL